LNVRGRAQIARGHTGEGNELNVGSHRLFVCLYSPATHPAVDMTRKFSPRRGP
jgi:hypothetical protein